MTTFLLARHGETAWNRERRWQGNSDIPLNDVGRRQAEELADRLADERLAAIYSSDLLRAYETAAAVARRKGMEVIVEPDLREIHLGSWEGLTTVELEERFPEDIVRWRAGELVVGRGGETHEQLRERVLAAAERIAAAHADDQVLVVSHGGAVRALAIHADAIDRDHRLENCGVVRIVFEEGAFRPVH
jgi:probable phosphoglycerate mutase